MKKKITIEVPAKAHAAFVKKLKGKTIQQVLAAFVKGYK